MDGGKWTEWKLFQPNGNDDDDDDDDYDDGKTDRDAVVSRTVIVELFRILPVFGVHGAYAAGLLFVKGGVENGKPSNFTLTNCLSVCLSIDVEFILTQWNYVFLSHSILCLLFCTLNPIFMFVSFMKLNKWPNCYFWNNLYIPHSKATQEKKSKQTDATFGHASKLKWNSVTQTNTH